MATAVNSIHGGCTSEIMANICKGEWQIVLISPEIILSKPFIKEVLRSPAMASRILSVVVDEAHVVSHWGTSFRKQYAELGILRAILPKSTPFVAMSATLAPRVRDDILKKLQFNEKNYVDINIGNGRPNISIVVCGIQNPMNTFSDLDFVIPIGVKSVDNIPKTFIYTDQISAEVGIETRLTEHLPPALCDIGLICPFSATFSPDHRQQLLDLLKAGIIRILICTDAAGMGCNIPDVDVVVQWKLSAGRDPKRTSLAVLLVEKSVYEADLMKLDEALSDNKKKQVRQSSTYPKAPKGYAIRHGIQHGSFDGFCDENLLKEDVLLDRKSLDEGLYSLVQSGMCRQRVLTTIYRNDTPHESRITAILYPTIPCCDLCDPTLLDCTWPAPKINQPKAMAIKTGIVNETSILGDESIENLSSVGPIGRLNELERVVGMDWLWFGQYGDNLLEEIKGLDIHPMQCKQQQKRAEKNQKQAVTAPTQNPTPTAVNPMLPSHITAPAPPPAPISTPHLYAMPYRYATPQQQTYNPYSSMTHPYAIYPPFYGYYQTPMQPNPQVLSNVGPQN
ncbi:hypothetical protein K443DRAFT_135401 [Laccaria amethystina LaAM-08-1]|uniref:DNA 3'-5' helicase n=1 Tax=Laccaria amethystina LaAM-08-1 TaxID=1095629 RepID=A0A0C9WNF4_9AGAR|nr:hypothetical protein K443DRAFT_135401 [Laccaria amethystina LaAM-08-1]